uniref:Putative secreted protein n=1 Tax=Ixodes ricinus TaxID=34613 RepID=A0A090XD14_IXORI
MCKREKTMFALFFLGVLFFCQSHATLSQGSGGDDPDAKEVMLKLPLTYMIRSLGEYDLRCGYQRFYNETQGSDKRTYEKYDLYFWYRNGRMTSQPRYVRRVTGSTIHMGNRPEEYFPETSQLQILFSDVSSCMITRNPDKAFPKACNLMVTKGSSSAPPRICLTKFQQHCNSTGFTYAIDNNCPEPPTK